jgi:predicted DNA-binding transcriptional regulator AlpA
MSNQLDREPLVNAHQVAKRLGVSKSWVLAHASGSRRPALKSIKLGKRVMFRPSDIDEFISECERVSSASPKVATQKLTS